MILTYFHINYRVTRNFTAKHHRHVSTMSVKHVDIIFRLRCESCVELYKKYIVILIQTHTCILIVLKILLYSYWSFSNVQSWHFTPALYLRTLYLHLLPHLPSVKLFEIGLKCNHQCLLELTYLPLGVNVFSPEVMVINFPGLPQVMVINYPGQFLKV